MLDFRLHTTSTPEQRLVAAILTQAFTDMFLEPTERSSESNTRALDSDKAISFLTDRHGKGAKWRNTLCSCLGLDGDVLCTRVRAILNGDADPPSQRPQLTARLKHARARWHEMVP